MVVSWQSNGFIYNIKSQKYKNEQEVHRYYQESTESALCWKTYNKNIADLQSGRRIEKEYSLSSKAPDAHKEAQKQTLSYKQSNSSPDISSEIPLFLPAHKTHKTAIIAPPESYTKIKGKKIPKTVFWISICF